MHKVLLVDDSEEIQLVVKTALAASNVTFLSTGSRESTKKFIAEHGADFDLVILDLVLPDGDGFEVLEDLRRSGMSKDSPVFFLSSQAELTTKVTAFKLGVDDYLVKPVSPVELRARVEMRLKKAREVLHDQIVKGDLVVELKSLRASRMVAGAVTDMHLTGKEFKILAFLVQHESAVFTRQAVVAEVWGPSVHILDRTVDSHIHGLRKKMGPIASYIECIPNLGYRFSSKQRAAAV